MKNNLSSQISLSRVSSKLYQTDDVLELSRISRMEKVPTRIYENAREGALQLAATIAQRIRKSQAEGEKFVLSVVTGRTMTDIFAELVRMHREENLSFRNVVLFNTYEYYPLQNAAQGCMAQLKEQFIDHVDIKPENVFAFDGMMDQRDIIPMIGCIELKIQ